MSKTRVAVVGCGSVSDKYLPDLLANPFVEVTSLCDASKEQVKRQAETFGIDRTYSDISQLMADGQFDLLVNLTSMKFHAPINRMALEAGKHVWCEKPMATDLKEAYELISLAKQKGLGMWAAPNSPTSPAFKTMKEIVASGSIGKVFAAHGIYGSEGPSWSPWFYKKGGGALYDLGVYNITTLAAILGPVQRVTAFIGTALPERTIDIGNIEVESDDNAVVVMDHGNSVLSVIQTGYVYGKQLEDVTIQIIGTNGAVAMEGYDWDPKGVRVCEGMTGQWKTVCRDQKGYDWFSGASYVAECLAMGKEPEMTGEQAVHVLEIMNAAHESARTGRVVNLESTFFWK
ncbi:Gfo/Idh/MocA family protein [Cohnella silvisoli]|uniref:Gfo/Idh/MocA family oxidoreductase n=1 Tax=Cohnella silvisoli TaxID=2873699 RepID=A0ABV1KTN5_9BACL|nr:Gfo/Idh/MocA family oxidoreductase [Cohnella silvisoli]MCD9022859.1 Gfo/Idh/MocA family oxidoreductase [Cohnella silvisoli]